MAVIYKVHDNTLVLSDSLGGSNRAYVLKIHDMPPEEKPREKLSRFGPQALSVAELLAVILNVGTKKEDVMSLSARVLHEYGEKSLVSQKDPAALAADTGIPLGKAMQIIACAELGRRFFQRTTNGATVIRTPHDVFEYARDMRTLPKEHLRGIYLDTHHRIIHDEIISIGTVNANIIHPREVFRPALAHAAAGVVLVHNHPSGVTTPSFEDHETTRRIVEAGRILGIEVLDHVIVTRDSFESIVL